MLPTLGMPFFHALGVLCTDLVGDGGISFYAGTNGARKKASLSPPLLFFDDFESLALACFIFTLLLLAFSIFAINPRTRAISITIAEFSVCV